MGFSTNEIVVKTGDGLNMTLVEPFSYTTKTGEVITVPAGAISDGASTPRALWISFPPFGTYYLAVFLHDHLYKDTERPKAECDNILLEAMQSLGVNELEAKTIYEGVKFFAWSAYEGDRKAEEHKHFLTNP